MNKKKSGAEPQRVKIDLNWESAIGKALKKPPQKEEFDKLKTSKK